jgi:hypothetical protein
MKNDSDAETAAAVRMSNTAEMGSRIVPAATVIGVPGKRTTVSST